MNAPANGTPIISVRGLVKEFRMGEHVVRALRGVDLTVNRNEYVAVMGPSGSGKSTFMNVIGCLDSASGGEYALNGHRVAGLDENALAQIRNREIGFVFQSFNLLPRATALQNVQLPLAYARVPRKERKARAAEMLGLVGLGERMDHKPSELSGGQRQRVAIARALVTKPALLLADEPTGALDTKTGEEVMALFADLHRQGQTLLMVTHEPDIAAHAHRVIHLRDGVIERDERRADAGAKDGAVVHGGQG